MGLREGDLIRFRMNKIEGIVVGFKTSEFNGNYHKIVVHCTYSPYNNRLNGTIIEINNHSGDVEVITKGKINV